MLQIQYQHEQNNEELIHCMFKDEANALLELGIMTDTKPLKEAKQLLYRGEFLTKENYPTDSRFINNFETYSNCLLIDRWYPIIKDLTIETFLSYDLNSETEKTIIEKGWTKAFVKNAVKSLTFISHEKSIWPSSSFSEMKSLFLKHSFFNEYYSIRKYIDSKNFNEENRYWVINNRIYNPNKYIPDIVVEASEKLKILNNRFYVIDATPNLIIEVNPGETSIRYANNATVQFSELLNYEFN